MCYSILINEFGHGMTKMFLSHFEKGPICLKTGLPKHFLRFCSGAGSGLPEVP